MKNRTAIVITLASHHIHYCKALITSINYFNPGQPIIILKDGDFNTNFLSKQKNVSIVDSRDVNTLHNLDLYILLNKLNILFLPELGFDYDWFIHLDADSILTNPLNLEDFSDQVDFCILQGKVIECNDEKSMSNLAHYAFNPLDFPEYSFDSKQLYQFSASHIAVNKRIIPLLIDILKIHRNELNKIFLNDKRIRFNDQGFLNLVINFLSYEKKINVRLNDCGIYGYEDKLKVPLLTLENIVSKKDTNVVFIHYTGPSRKPTLKAHNFGDILEFFVKRFYNNNKLSFNSSEIVRLINYHYKSYKKRIIYRLNNFKDRVFNKKQSIDVMR